MKNFITAQLLREKEIYNLIDKKIDEAFNFINDLTNKEKIKILDKALFEDNFTMIYMLCDCDTMSIRDSGEEELKRLENICK